MSMKVRDVMSSPAVTVGPDASFADIVERLLGHDISGVPVVDAGGRLLGMVTEADLVSKEAYRGEGHRPLDLVAGYLRGHDPQWVRKAAASRAADLMTADVITTAPDDDLRKAARTVLESHHTRLPVVEGGRVVGVVSRHDLLKPFGRGDAEITADIDRILTSPLTAPEGHECLAAVRAGVVTLTGSTRWPSDARVLVSMIDGVPGVVAVVDELVAREREPHVTRA